MSIIKPFFGATTENINYANLCVIGIPWDASSSYRTGAHQGPIIIRSATSGALYNKYTELGVDLTSKCQIFDAGDVPITNSNLQEDQKSIFNFINKYNKYSMRFIFLGGDHLSTYFSYSALKKVTNANLGILYLDAHPDLYDNYEGDRYSHACVLKRIIEETHTDPEHIVQVGIRATTPEQDNYAKQIGIKSFTTKDFHQYGPQQMAELVKRSFPSNISGIYFSFDLDILDPAFAPGVGNPQPGGLSTREVLDFIHALHGMNIYSFDVVELCPKVDYSGITSFAGAMIIKEILGLMIR